ncbi:MAG: TIGR02444 family protein [Pseudomonadota bacterium]
MGKEALTLWDYATGLYQRPGVASECLRLQDSLDLDVCLLLFVAWLSDRGLTLTDKNLKQVTDSCRTWRQEVVLPLRERRRRWKTDLAHSWEYEALKGLELQAEREQMDHMEASARSFARDDTEKPSASPGNLPALGSDTLLRNLETLSSSLAIPLESLSALREAVSA